MPLLSNLGFILGFYPYFPGQSPRGPHDLLHLFIKAPLPHPCFPGRRRWEGREGNSFLTSETHRLGLIGESPGPCPFLPCSI